MLLWGWALALAIPISVMAQSDPEPMDYELLRGIVSQLEHAQYDKREEASRRLGELISHRNVNTLEVFLEDPSISSEQRFRLLEVYGDKTLNRPSGALGISMDPINRGNGPPEVLSLLPGMPAAGVLKIGDRIRRIDGITIRSNQELRQFVQAKEPGDRVLITLDRQKRKENGLPDFDINNRIVYESIHVELRLGSVKQLNDINGGRSNDASILKNRKDRVQEANKRHAPPVLEITISNRQDMYDSIVRRSSENEEVDDHPIIQIMLADADRILNGRQRITRVDQDRWDSYIRQISREFLNPKNRKRDQDYLILVTKRYNELLRRIKGVPDASAFTNRP